MTDEHDDLPDERRLLASAYLDDELSPAERARAESDPAVLAEIDVLLSVRAAVAAVPAPDPARRDAAIAAAMAAAGATVEAPPRPAVGARRRARWYARLAAAAAAAVLVVGGIVALRDGGDDDAGPSDVTRQAPADAQTADDGDNEAGAGATTAAAADAPDVAAPPTTAAGAGTTLTAGESATEGTSAEDTQSSFDASDPIVRDGPDLVALVELEEAAGPDRSASPAGSPIPRCQLGAFVTFASYQPSPQIEPRDIEVIIDPSGAVLAADAVTCEIVLRATP